MKKFGERNGLCDMSKEEKFKASDNIIEIVKLIDRVADPFNISYEPEQKEHILNKLYDLLDFQIKLMEENEDE